MWQVSSSKNVEFIQTPLGGIYEPSVEPSVQTLSYFPPSDALAASHKNAVHLRLDLKGNLRDRSEVCGEQRDHTIRVFRLTKPVAIAQHCDPGRGEKAHFRGELAGLLTAIIKFGSDFFVEEHHGFAGQHPVFSSSKGSRKQRNGPNSPPL